MNKLILLLGVVALAYAQTQSVSITLFATDLTGCNNLLSKCDGYVKIFCQSTQTDWRLCGQTAVKKNEDFPIWSETFTFQHTANNSERWRFDVMNQKLLVDQEIGSVLTTPEIIVNSLVKPVRFNLNGRGWLNVMKLN